jgi:hypothetical protein
MPKSGASGMEDLWRREEEKKVDERGYQERSQGSSRSGMQLFLQAVKDQSCRGCKG